MRMFFPRPHINVRHSLLLAAALPTIFVLLMLSPSLYATVYYVDATNGKDSNDGISPATAWRTASKVSSSWFSPGDQILFKKGEIWHETLSVPSSGSIGNPVVFGAYWSGNNPIFDGENARDNSIIIANRSHITVDGVLCQNIKSEGILIGGTSDHVTIQNSEIKFANKGIGIYDPAGGGNIFRNNEIHDIATEAISANPHTGSSSGNETLVQRNRIYNAGRFGMFCRVNFWIIEDNVVFAIGTNKQVGIECIGIEIYSGSPSENSGDYNIIRRNTISGILSAGNEGSAMEADRWCDYNQFYYNLAYQNDGPGITLYDAKHSFVANNTFYNNSLNSSGQLMEICEIRLLSSAPGLTTFVQLKNNIAYAAQPLVYSIYIDANTQNSSFNIDRNCWYKSGGSSWWFIGNAGGSDLAEWHRKMTTGMDMLADPVFINLSLKNFALESKSPCRDTGANTNLGPDILLHQVPQGNAHDIGAFEFIPSSVGNPMNLRISQYVAVLASLTAT
jgi:parallel beta-helix repeat protein